MSTAEFMAEMPYDANDPALWLYRLHNKVNAKLRSQAARGELKDAPDIGPDPSFKDVEAHYSKLLRRRPSALPGLDFISAVAYNYDPEVPDKREGYGLFFRELVQAWPFEHQRKLLKAYMADKPIEEALDNRKDVIDWWAGASKCNVTAKCQPYSSTCKKITCRSHDARNYPAVHARLLRNA